MKTIKENGGSITVEAAFIAPFTILLVFAIIIAAMFFRSKTAAAAAVRNEIEQRFSDVMTGSSDKKTFFEKREKPGVKIWPFSALSYSESAEKTFIKAPDELFDIRFLKNISEAFKN